MVTSAIVSTIVFTLPQTKDNFAYQMLIIVPISTLTWLVTTWVTSPVSEERLIAFYQRIRPNGGWWGRIPSLANVQPIGESGMPALLNWVLGSAFVYCTLFGFGKLLLGFYGVGVLFLLIALITGGLIYRGLPAR
jgi:hypothetical protein